MPTYEYPANLGYVAPAPGTAIPWNGWTYVAQPTYVPGAVYPVIQSGATTYEGLKLDTSVWPPRQIAESAEGKQSLIECEFRRLEVKEKNGRSVITGKAQEADTPNRNGRVYPKSILKREVARMNEELDRRPGAVDHPESAASLSDIGLKFTRLYLEGNDVMFEAEIIPTRKGKDLEAVIASGIEVGISSRGYGSVKREMVGSRECMVIQDDFELVTFDAVTDPSVYTARIQTMESSEQMKTFLADHPEFVEMVARALSEMNMSKTETQVEEQTTTEVAETAEATATTEEAATEQAVEATAQGADEAAKGEEADAVSDTEQTEEATEEAATEEAATEETATDEATADEAVAETTEEAAETTEEAVDESAARIAQLEARLAEANAAQTAIQAIITLIQQELGEQDFWDVSSLASAAAFLQRWDTSDGEDHDDSFKSAVDATVEAVKGLVRYVSTQKVSDYIETLTATEQHGAKIAAHLRKVCTTKESVDMTLPEAKALIASIIEDSSLPGGKGVVNDPQARRTSAIAELARKARVAA